jgi:hypothetical protein
MEGFPENTFTEEPIVAQAPETIPEVTESAPLSQREVMMSMADEDTANFVRSFIEEPALQ